MLTCKRQGHEAELAIWLAFAQQKPNLRLSDSNSTAPWVGFVYSAAFGLLVELSLLWKTYVSTRTVSSRLYCEASLSVSSYFTV